MNKATVRPLLHLAVGAGLILAASHVMAANFTIESLAAKSNAGYDFGQKIINWITYGSDTATTTGVSLLSVLSKTLNTIALFMLAVLSVFGGGNYIIQTANKGVPGGQVISSFWAPLRISVATIMMIPLTSGYSLLQYGVTSIAEEGNTHANILMEKGLNYLYDFGAYRPIALIDGQDIIFGWVASEVCKQYINSYTKTSTIGYTTSTYGSVDTGYKTTISYPYKESASSSKVANPRTEYCGSISISGPAKWQTPTTKGALTYAKANDDSSAIASTAQASLISLINSLQPSVASIASKIMSDQSALQNMQSQGSSAQATFESAVKTARSQAGGLASDIEEVITTYNQGRQKIVATAVSSANSATKGKADWKAQTIDGGWPLLGTIFWQINTNQSKINSLAQAMIATSVDPQLDNEWAQDQRLHELAERVAATKKAYAGTGASILQTQADSDNTPIPSLSAIALAGSDGGIFDTTKMLMYSGLSWITKKALFHNSPDDLVINIQYIGSAIGTGAEAFYLSKAAVFTGIKWAADTAIAAGNVVTSNVINLILPTGLAAKAVGGVGAVTNGVIESLTKFLLPMADDVLMMLIAVGFIAGVLFPTIPLSIWFMGVTSWFLFYIECLLVSPFWLAAHGTAEKEGWGSEHTRQGYMLMIGLYLNPILRVAGFFAIFLALKPAAWLVYWFFDYVAGVLTSGFVFLFASVGSVIVSIMFAYSLITRVFGLPSELFERGLRWVNGGHEVTGDSHNEEGARRNFMAFVSKSEGMSLRPSMRPDLNGMKKKPPVKDKKD